MSEEKKNEEKTCWACKRTFEGHSVLGLCPDCVNKVGTTAVGIVGLTVLTIFTGKYNKKK